MRIKEIVFGKRFDEGENIGKNRLCGYSSKAATIVKI
jgi:hypothetical protein